MRCTCTGRKAGVSPICAMADWVMMPKWTPNILISYHAITPFPLHFFDKHTLPI